MLQYFVAILSLAVGVQSFTTFYACSYITKPEVDCEVFPFNETCGTNYLTYKNMCYFSQAHCNDTSLDVLHYGACTKSDLPTSPPNPIRGQAILIAVLCGRLAHKTCDDNAYEPICARFSNGDLRTYKNFCEYEKGKCMHRELHVADFGDCSA